MAGATRANLAPQEPFFQLGLVGATVPALKIDGEIGQQLGYLAANTRRDRELRDPAAHRLGVRPQGEGRRDAGRAPEPARPPLSVLRVARAT